jgi:hypothetical protein
MTTISPPPAGLALATLIPLSVRRMLGFRVILTGEQMDLGSEVLIVQVGPAAPYRLLLMQMAPDGLVQVELMEVGKRTKVVACRKVLTDLVGLSLERWGDEWGLVG